MSKLRTSLFGTDQLVITPMDLLRLICGKVVKVRALEIRIGTGLPRAAAAMAKEEV